MERASRFPAVNTKLIPQGQPSAGSSELQKWTVEVFECKILKSRVTPMGVQISDSCWATLLKLRKIPQFGLKEPYLGSSVWRLLYTYVKAAASSSGAVLRKASSHVGTGFWTFDFAHPPRLKPGLTVLMPAAIVTILLILLGKQYWRYQKTVLKKTRSSRPHIKL